MERLNANVLALIAAYLPPSDFSSLLRASKIIYTILSSSFFKYLKIEKISHQGYSEIIQGWITTQYPIHPLASICRRIESEDDYEVYIPAKYIWKKKSRLIAASVEKEEGQGWDERIVDFSIKVGEEYYYFEEKQLSGPHKSDKKRDCSSFYDRGCILVY